MRPQAPTPTATPTAIRPQRPQAATRSPRRRADWCSAQALAAALIFALVTVVVAGPGPGQEQEQEQGAAASCAQPAAQPADRPAGQPALKVILYTTPGCAPCRIAAADLATLPGIEVARTNDCPQWVTQVPTLAWQISTPSGFQWVQFAPKHWRGPTWRGEWPRVRQTLQQALQQALQHAPKTERIAPPPATPQRPTVDHRVLFWGHQLSEQQQQQQQPQAPEAEAGPLPTSGWLVSPMQSWRAGEWHSSPLVALPAGCAYVRGTVSPAPEFRASPRLAFSIRLVFQDAQGRRIQGCGGGIVPRTAFEPDEPTPITGHEANQQPGEFPGNSTAFFYSVNDSLGAMQPPYAILAGVEFCASLADAEWILAAATIEAFDAGGDSLEFA
jgi:hypothetical protein